MIRLLAALRDAHDLPTMSRFAGVGLVTTVLDVAMFAVLSAAVLPALANVASYSSGIALSYALNRRWTFGGGNASLRQAFKFVLATLSGLVLSTLLLMVMARIMPPVAAKLATVPIVFLWNYHSTRQWVFRAT